MEHQAARDDAVLPAIFMGAGNGAGAYFFVRVYRTRHWHEVSIGVLSAAVFALLMLVTTLIHFDKFNQGRAHDGLPDPPALATIAFYAWRRPARADTARAGTFVAR